MARSSIKYAPYPNSKPVNQLHSSHFKKPLRDYDREIGDRVKYRNEFLTQARVEQIFDFYGLRENNYYDRVETSNEYDEEYSQKEGQEVQLCLELENLEDVEEKLRDMILKYQRALDVMGSFALLWHDLMMDLETIPHLEEEFNKFQMIRKMRGGQA
jgi:hypothetical protein